MITEYKPEADQELRKNMLGGTNASTIAGDNPFSNNLDIASLLRS